MSENDLGFSAKAREKSPAPQPPAIDLTGFEAPTPSKNLDIDDNTADRAAERAGFTARDAEDRYQKTPKSREPLDTLYIRTRLSVANRFKRYCDTHEISYAHLLEKLMTSLDD